MNKNLIRDILNSKADKLALLTVIATDSTSPRAVGTQMIVYPGGKIKGTIGGGKNEHEVIKKAREWLRENRSGKIKFTTPDREEIASGWVCGGDTEIFVEIISLTSKNTIES